MTAKAWKVSITCPFCAKEFKAREDSPVSTCNHCHKSFRKDGDVPMKHDMSGPLTKEGK
jgi:ribosomal protein L37AE/L43A